jgi:hypothetical protein
MSFFVTSVGLGRGGNLGGLAGADAHCQALAAAVGRGNVTWRAYLSTQGPNAVNARDRIGTGPWYNQRGQVIAGSVAQLQGDTLDQARIGNFINVVNALDEKGQPVPGNEHDILTGSMLDGRANTDPTRDYTCNNWTSAADGGLAAGIVPDPIPPGVPSARLGHSDKGNIVPSWNSSHPSRGCSQESLVATGGGGRLYCFADSADALNDTGNAGAFAVDLDQRADARPELVLVRHVDDDGIGFIQQPALLQAKLAGESQPFRRGFDAVDEHRYDAAVGTPQIAEREGRGLDTADGPVHPGVDRAARRQRPP